VAWALAGPSLCCDEDRAVGIFEESLDDPTEAPMARALAPVGSDHDELEAVLDGMVGDGLSWVPAEHDVLEQTHTGCCGT